jgi:GST-like protein
MIELFSANTPNGWKIGIMLEEIGYQYKVTKIDLGKDEQFNPDFLKISPFGKIPVITDYEDNKSIFESGAILMYLGEKSGKFYNEEDRLVINQWLMAQMGTIGPMIGQHHKAVNIIAMSRTSTISTRSQACLLAHPGALRTPAHPAAASLL